MMEKANDTVAKMTALKCWASVFDGRFRNRIFVSFAIEASASGPTQNRSEFCPRCDEWPAGSLDCAHDHYAGAKPEHVRNCEAWKRKSSANS